MPPKKDLDRITLVLENYFGAAADLSKEIDIIRSLQYDSMLTRHSMIPETYQDTFDWVFNTEHLPKNDPRSNIGLNTWLKCKEGIFWVAGKPGSGKPTLMKYISDDPRTVACLQW